MGTGIEPAGNRGVVPSKPVPIFDTSMMVYYYQSTAYVAQFPVFAAVENSEWRTNGSATGDRYNVSLFDTKMCPSYQASS